MKQALASRSEMIGLRIDDIAADANKISEIFAKESVTTLFGKYYCDWAIELPTELVRAVEEEIEILAEKEVDAALDSLGSSLADN